MSAVVAAGVVAALMIAGGLVGRWTAASVGNASAPGPSASTAGGQSYLGPAAGAEPPPPLSGAGDLPGAPLSLAMNQPFGDGNTVFVAHGRGWQPGSAITVGLASVRASPYRVVADRRGTFNYAVNEAHEFFPGALPPGVYQLVATGAGGRRAQASFRVGG